jgi:hypothetical protein
MAVAPQSIMALVLIGFPFSELSVTVQETTKWSLLKSNVDISRDFFFFLRRRQSPEFTRFPPQ